MMNYWVLVLGLSCLCGWTLTCFLAAWLCRREDVAKIKLAYQQEVLRDMVLAYNRGDSVEMILILGSVRFSDLERG